jgi:hypothetical protein
MKRALRVYIFCIYGALGGLMASFLHQHLLLETLSKPLPPSQRLIYLAALGGLVGASIGFFPSFSEGRGNYSLGGAVRAGLKGAVLGAIGGAIALPLAETMHIRLSGGITGRALSLAAVGLFIGIAEGIIGGARPVRGIAGGIVGGLIAGYVLEKLVTSQATHADSGIVALMSIGLIISLFISLFVNVLAAAWLEGQPGSKVSGQVFHLSKFRRGERARLGSDNKGSIFIWVPDAQPIHAEITLSPNGALLQHVAKTGVTRVNGAQVGERLLRDGDMIEIGRSRFKYRERKSLFSAPTAAGLGTKTAHT